jgi:hypothetical protein
VIFTVALMDVNPPGIGLGFVVKLEICSVSGRATADAETVALLPVQPDDVVVVPPVVVPVVVVPVVVVAVVVVGTVVVAAVVVATTRETPAVPMAARTPVTARSETPTTVRRGIERAAFLPTFNRFISHLFLCSRYQ